MIKLNETQTKYTVRLNELNDYLNKYVGRVIEDKDIENIVTDLGISLEGINADQYGRRSLYFTDGIHEVDMYYITGRTVKQVAFVKIGGKQL